MIKKILISTLIVFLGATFILSGVTKYLALDFYEISLVEQNLATWNSTRFISRLIISLEIALGLLIIAHYYIKFLLKGTVLLLCAFSILLALQILFGTELENCFCFGETFQMTNAESILKNGVLILLSIIILKYEKHLNLQYGKKWLVITSVIFLSILTINILYPPINIYKEFSIDTFKPGDNFPKLKSMPEEVYEGNVILAFLSPKCSHCRLAAQKIAILEDRGVSYNIMPFFGFGIKDIPSFVDETKMQSPWSLINKKDFLKFTKGVFPQIYILQNGVIVEILNKRRFIEKKID